MLADEFQSVYNLFKTNFYASMCANSKELTMPEAFSLDVIYMLGNPTILEYARYMNISQPNATYKINQLIEKGYLTKELNEKDKRSYHLQVTSKFLDFYRDNDRYIQSVLSDISDIFDEKQIQLLEIMLRTVRERVENKTEK